MKNKKVIREKQFWKVSTKRMWMSSWWIRVLPHFLNIFQKSNFENSFSIEHCHADQYSAFGKVEKGSNFSLECLESTCEVI